MSQIRLRKVESLLKEEISSILLKNEVKDPRINTLITVTYVTISRDLKFAKIYISFFGDKGELKRTVDALNHASGFIQGLLGKRVHLRNIPKLTFILDESIDKGFRITQKLKEIIT